MFDSQGPGKAVSTMLLQVVFLQHVWAKAPTEKSKKSSALLRSCIKAIATTYVRYLGTVVHRKGWYG